MIHTWGLLAGIAIVAALLVALREAKRKNIDENRIIDITLLIVAGSVIGARLFFVAESWDYYSQNIRAIFSLGDGGLMFYGGAVGAFLAFAIYIKLMKLEKVFPDILDTVAPSLAVGEFFGRVGCALVNEHVGAITNFPWGQFYPFDDTVRHPVSIYMAINGLIIFIVIWLLRKKIQSRGMLFVAFLLIYSAIRFFVDFARCNDLAVCDPHYYGFTPSQIISMAVFFVSLGFALKYSKILSVKSGFELKKAIAKNIDLKS